MTQSERVRDCRLPSVACVMITVTPALTLALGQPPGDCLVHCCNSQAFYTSRPRGSRRPLRTCLEGAADGPDPDLSIGVSAVQGLAICGPGQGDAEGYLRLLAQAGKVGLQLVHDALALQIPDLHSRHPASKKNARKSASHAVEFSRTDQRSALADFRCSVVVPSLKQENADGVAHSLNYVSLP